MEEGSERTVPRETEKGTGTPAVGDRLRRRYQRRASEKQSGGEVEATSRRRKRDGGQRGSAAQGTRPGSRQDPLNLGSRAPARHGAGSPLRRLARAWTLLGPCLSPRAAVLSQLKPFCPARAGGASSGAACPPCPGPGPGPSSGPGPGPGPTSCVRSQLPHSPSQQELASSPLPGQGGSSSAFIF